MTRGSWKVRSPAPEKRLLAALRAATPSVVGFSDDFFELATAGALDADDASTQLALIYADGNQVGAFLTRVSRWIEKHGGPSKSDIAKAIDAATLESLVSAVTRTFITSPPRVGADDGTARSGARDDRSRPPVLVHLAGGDDILVSVPAGDGWPFVRAMVHAFDEAMADRDDAWGLKGSIALPSLSAGLVFHHHTHPFSDVVERAESRLASAKKAFNGSSAAVAFLDLTSDGNEPACGRPARTRDWLDVNADLLSRLATAPGSQRSGLTALCRQASEPVDPRQDGESACQALARRAVDLGSRAVWEVVAGPGATADIVRDLLLEHPDKRADLLHHLDLARWWPPQEESVAVEPAAAGGAR